MANPLIVEALAGLRRSGRIHLSYFNYLLLQATVLLLWWPKSSLIGWLEGEVAPDTLSAVLVAVAVTIAYYSLRAGAEELLLPAQHSLWEWVLATGLKPGRILRGYCGSHILLTLHAIMLSSPFLVMGYAVAGNTGSALIWSVIAIVFQAIFFRLLGAVMYMMIGHYEHLMFLSLRAALVLGYLLIFALLAMTSQSLLSTHLLENGIVMSSSNDVLSRIWSFILINMVLCLLFGGLLYWLIVRRRRLLTVAVSAEETDKARHG